MSAQANGPVGRLSPEGQSCPRPSSGTRQAPENQLEDPGSIKAQGAVSGAEVSLPFPLALGLPRDKGPTVQG